MRRPLRSGRTRAASPLLVAACAIGALVGCGTDEFANKPRPPVPLNLTGVITDKSVDVSPRQIGAGPVRIVVANQTDESHTVTLEGDRQRETVGPINPGDTAEIQATLDPGTYVVKAGSERAVAPNDRIEPARLQIGNRRPTAEDELLLP